MNNINKFKFKEAFYYTIKNNLKNDINEDVLRLLNREVFNLVDDIVDKYNALIEEKNNNKGE